MKKKQISKILIIIAIVVTISCGYIIKDNISSKSKKVINYNGESLKISIDGQKSGSIPSSGNYYLSNYSCENSSIEIDWDMENHKLNITSNKDSNSIDCNLFFESRPLLSSMPIGSYVNYVGSNGCGSNCAGNNPNYENENKMGFCNNEKYQFVANGWRIAYINGGAHIVSAGATDCLCTNSDGSTSSGTCSTNVTDVTTHLNKLDAKALTYCNPTYAKGGSCSNTTAWALDNEDVYKMSAINISSTYCMDAFGTCGYNNELIDNGGYYWFASIDGAVRDSALHIWYPINRYISSSASSKAYGVRPIIALSPNVVVTGGKGTAEEPYELDVDEGRDSSPPTCSISGPTTAPTTGYIKDGQTLTYTLTCTDDSGTFTDSTISTSDLSSNNASVMNVTNVGTKTEVSNGYSWPITVTAGTSTGSARIILNENAVSDYVGNSNDSVTSTQLISTDNQAPTCGTTSYSTTDATTNSVTITVPCTDTLSKCASNSYTKTVSANGSGTITIADKLGNSNSCSYSVNNIYKLSISSSKTYYANGVQDCLSKFWHNYKYTFTITATGYGVSSGNMCHQYDGTNYCSTYATSSNTSYGVGCFYSATSWAFFRSGGCVTAQVTNTAGKMITQQQC